MRLREDAVEVAVGVDEVAAQRFAQRRLIARDDAAFLERRENRPRMCVTSKR
jgi:hypothetical protein